MCNISPLICSRKLNLHILTVLVLLFLAMGNMPRLLVITEKNLYELNHPCEKNLRRTVDMFAYCSGKPKNKTVQQFHAIENWEWEKGW